MNTSQIDRRLASPSAFPNDIHGGADIVRQALRIQACLGTVGAVEYLKGRTVDGAVIRRVLDGARVRASDRPSG